MNHVEFSFNSPFWALVTRSLHFSIYVNLRENFIKYTPTVYIIEIDRSKTQDENTMKQSQKSAILESNAGDMKSIGKCSLYFHTNKQTNKKRVVRSKTSSELPSLFLKIIIVMYNRMIVYM